MMIKVKHICGQCSKTFENESDYLIHVCASTGLSLTQGTNIQSPADQKKQQVVTNKLTGTIVESDILAKVLAARQIKRG